MLSQCRVLSITKKVISYLLVLGQQPLMALQIQDLSIKCFNYTSKSPETLLTQTIFVVMSRNTNKVEKTGTNFDLTTDSSIEKSNYFNKV